MASPLPPLAPLLSPAALSVPRKPGPVPVLPTSATLKRLVVTAPSSGGAVCETPQPPPPPPPPRTLTTVKLVLVTVAAVAGGPFGLEEGIASGGPAWTFAALVVLPLVWSAPLALLTAELANLLPENGGHILWVDRAFGGGGFWSVQNCVWSLCSNVLEGSLYPSLLLDHAEASIGHKLGSLVRLGMGGIIVAFSCVINRYGMEAVVSASAVFTFASLMPFVMIVVLGLPKVSFGEEWRGAVTGEVPEPEWGQFITIMLWNSAGYDQLGAVAGEVKDPARTFPVAVGISVLVAVLLDVLVVGVSVNFEGNFENWTDGTFIHIARRIGGEELATMFGAGAFISMFGYLCTLLTTSSRLTLGMSLVGTLPGVLARGVAENGTPMNALVANAVLITFLSVLPFKQLALVEMLFYSLSTILKFLALIRLRNSMRTSARPFKIPLKGIALVLFATPPVLCCVAIIVLSGYWAQLMGLGSMLVGTAVYGGIKRTGAGAAVRFNVLTESP